MSTSWQHWPEPLIGEAETEAVAGQGLSLPQTQLVSFRPTAIVVVVGFLIVLLLAI